MRATVLGDPALAKHAGRFVWLSINTEDARNAAFLERTPVTGYPTFMILDPATEQPALKWYGSLTVAQLEHLLDDGVQALAAAGGDDVARALARADRLNAEGDPARAAEAYAEVLRAAAPGWDRRARTVESLVFALDSAGDAERCARVASDEARALARGPSFANVAAIGLGCATGAAEDAAWRAGAIAVLEPLVVEALGLDSVLADDRSSLYGSLVDLRRARGDAGGAKSLAAEWLAFLEIETARAADPEARAAFDSHRVSAAIAAGVPERAVPAIEASERALPDDYNPPARLAALYRELRRYDDALAATGRALDRAYGPRKLRIYDARAETCLAMGDPVGARRALEEGLAYAAALPESQRPKRLVEQLAKKLAANR